jgi:hypothetical protein
MIVGAVLTTVKSNLGKISDNTNGAAFAEYADFFDKAAEEIQQYEQRTNGDIITHPGITSK